MLRSKAGIFSLGANMVKGHGALQDSGKGQSRSQDLASPFPKRTVDFDHANGLRTHGIKD
jgi:hypothetical protein